MKPAVFLDRDGTLIELVHYLSDPADLHLVAGAGESICRLQEAGFACIVVTNQSAIGRGLIDEPRLAEIHQVMIKKCEFAGATLDGIYFCPIAPKSKDPTLVEHPDRKPGPGMLIRASNELDLDLSASWMVGDTISDILAGRNAGCRGEVLVRTGYGEAVDTEAHKIDHVADDLISATKLILECSAE
jgi:D-glycero-D-manno-heptose 1,7-bisphosphate phosphatase